MAQKNCPSCGTLQPDSYAFCAECGTKLDDIVVAPPPAPRAAPAERPAPGPESAAGPAWAEPVRAVPPAAQPAPRPAAAPRPAPVETPRPAAAPRPAPVVEAPRPEPVPKAAELQEWRLEPPVARPRKKLTWTLVHLSRAGGTNVPYAVPEEGLQIGTAGCAIAFDDDKTMSPRHATVTITERGLKIEDAGSLNGLFQKITTDHILQDGDIFVCGDSVFRFSAEPAAITPDDFKLYAAADEACPAGTITKLLAGGIDGQVYPVLRRAVVIGREAADISCPEDRYMSRVHASVEAVAAGLALKDKQSRNGTYIKTSGSVVVGDGDVILVGRQLLKVEAKSL